MDYSGQQFGQYHIIEKLGQGGMATVYKAFDTRLEREVAIKVVRKESIPPEQLERILKRFEREAKSLAKFLHPNIVPVYDYGEWQGAPYLVMAYLPGGTLKERIGQPIPLDKALDWVIPIANALNYAHQRGVIHRDVKPSNILTTEEGALMLSDFGIARILEESTTQLTATGMGVGTPEYMAPEQWQGKATEASDQYALAVVLYELLTGQKPYTADTPLAVALKVMSEPLPRPSSFVPEIPDAVEKVLYKALAREPKDRYENMGDFQSALIGLKNFKVNTYREHEGPEVIAVPEAKLSVPVSEKFDSESETYDALSEPIFKKGEPYELSNNFVVSKKKPKSEIYQQKKINDSQLTKQDETPPSHIKAINHYGLFIIGIALALSAIIICEMFDVAFFLGIRTYWYLLPGSIILILSQFSIKDLRWSISTQNFRWKLSLWGFLGIVLTNLACWYYYHNRFLFANLQNTIVIIFILLSFNQYTKLNIKFKLLIGFMIILDGIVNVIFIGTILFSLIGTFSAPLILSISAAMIFQKIYHYSVLDGFLIGILWFFFDITVVYSFYYFNYYRGWPIYVNIPFIILLTGVMIGTLASINGRIIRGTQIYLEKKSNKKIR